MAAKTRHPRRSSRDHHSLHHPAPAHLPEHRQRQVDADSDGRRGDCGTGDDAGHHLRGNRSFGRVDDRRRHHGRRHPAELERSSPARRARRCRGGRRAWTLHWFAHQSITAGSLHRHPRHLERLSRHRQRHRPGAGHQHRKHLAESIDDQPHRRDALDVSGAQRVDCDRARTACGRDDAIHPVRPACLRGRIERANGTAVRRPG